MSIRLDKKLYFRGEKTPEFFKLIFSDKDLPLPRFDSVFCNYGGEYKELIREFIETIKTTDITKDITKLDKFDVEIERDQFNYNMLTVYVEPAKNYRIIAFDHSDDYNQFLDSVLKYVSIFFE